MNIAINHKRSIELVSVLAPSDTLSLSASLSVSLTVSDGIHFSSSSHVTVYISLYSPFVLACLHTQKALASVILNKCSRFAAMWNGETSNV